MADINSVVLVGRLTRDAELKYLNAGLAVCKFSLAINRRKKNGDNWEDEVNYFDVVLWGRQGEALSKYLTKGKPVGVQGELRQDRWEQDGQKRSRIEIVADNIQLLGGGPGEGFQGSDSGQDSGGSQNSWASKNGENKSPPSDDHFSDDIPF